MTQQPSSWQRFKATYTPLYRVLLILSSLAAIYGLVSLPAGIGPAFEALASDTIRGIGLLVNLFVVLPLSLAALFLLWNKHPVGITLKLASYGLAIIATSLSFFASSATLQTIIDASAASLKDNPQTATVLGPDAVASIATTSFYTSIVIVIIGNLIFAWLWWRAVRRQTRADAKARAKA